MAGPLLPWPAEEVVADTAQIRKPKPIWVTLHVGQDILNLRHNEMVALMIPPVKKNCSCEMAPPMAYSTRDGGPTGPPQALGLLWWLTPDRLHGRPGGPERSGTMTKKTKPNRPKPGDDFVTLPPITDPESIHRLKKWPSEWRPHSELVFQVHSAVDYAKNLPKQRKAKLLAAALNRINRDRAEVCEKVAGLDRSSHGLLNDYRDFCGRLITEVRRLFAHPKERLSRGKWATEHKWLLKGLYSPICARPSSQSGGGPGDQPADQRNLWEGISSEDKAAIEKYRTYAKNQHDAGKRPLISWFCLDNKIGNVEVFRSKLDQIRWRKKHGWPD